MQINLENITLRAGERAIFAHTSWVIPPGQHWAIFGPTGAGKTTLASAISRGSGLLSGQIQYSIPGEASRPYVYPHEIVTFSAETHRAFLQRFAEYHQARWQSFEGEDAPGVADLLAGGETGQRAAIFSLLGIEPLLSRRVHQLSNGESRKVFLANLLLGGPRLVILDDPFTGLDQESRTRLRAGIEGLLAQPSPAILLASSRWEEIPAGITHLLLIESGRVIGQGPREVVQQSVVFQTLAAAHQPVQAAMPASEAQAAALRERGSAYAAQLRDSGIAEGQEVLHLEQVSVSYPGVEVLKQVTWSVRQGERWALSGPNGAGKSTLLSLVLADHPQAYRNHLRLFGRRRGSGESIWEIKRKIGWVSPELQIFYERPLSCFETICSGFFDSVGLYRQPSPEQQTAAAGWLQALHLDRPGSRPLLNLSTGQPRLPLLATPLVKPPPLLVLDEPCQGLDSAQRAAFLALLDGLCAQAPITLIYVSHDPREIPQAVKHHLRLEAGQIVSIL